MSSSLVKYIGHKLGFFQNHTLCRKKLVHFYLLKLNRLTYFYYQNQTQDTGELRWDEDMQQGVGKVGGRSMGGKSTICSTLNKKKKNSIITLTPLQYGSSLLCFSPQSHVPINFAAIFFLNTENYILLSTKPLSSRNLASNYWNFDAKSTCFYLSIQFKFS